MNMRRVKKVLLALLGLLLLAQVVQPRRTNPPVVESRSMAAHIPVPAQIQGILKRSCYDCHSSATVWPWYSHTAPVSWLVTDDVNEGRRHINFQDWESLEAKEAVERLGLICGEVKSGDMPPRSYRIMHPRSVLSPEEVNAICSWSQSFIKVPEFPDKSPDKKD
jgi:Haem-binding domain